MVGLLVPTNGLWTVRLPSVAASGFFVLLRADVSGSIPKIVDRVVAAWRAEGKSIGNAEVARIKRELKENGSAERFQYRRPDN